MNSNNYCPDRLPCGICKRTYTQCMNPNYGIKITTATDCTNRHSQWVEQAQDEWTYGCETRIGEVEE